MNCLMIETKDRRRFFTHEHNYPQLIDYAKTFDAEISVVNLEDGQVLELADLAPALCDARYQKPKWNYEVVETKLAPQKNTRQAILKTAEEIRSYVTDRLLAGDHVSLSDLKQEFRKHKLTTACFCNHIRRVTEELAGHGIKVDKLAAGKYKVGPAGQFRLE